MLNMKKKEGNYITKRKIGIMAVVVLFALYFSLPFVFRPAINGDTVKPVSTTVVLPSALQKAKHQYEERHDLKSLVAYGNALDESMLEMDSVRAELQQQFFRELAKEAGKRYNVNWAVLFGLWKRESAVNPRAKGDFRSDINGRLIPGSHRAFGLGQVHLSTAKSHYDPNMTSERLMDPIENGMASAKILRDYMDMFGGKVKYGISAYQQGPVNTKLQYTKKINPKNIDYVIDVLQFAAEVN